MEEVKKVLGPRGVAVYNLCAKKPAFFAVCRRQFAGVFAQVHGMQTEDVNHPHRRGQSVCGRKNHVQ